MKNIIDDKKWTTLSHIDDLKTSHADPAVISIILAEIYADAGQSA